MSKAVLWSVGAFILLIGVLTVITQLTVSPFEPAPTPEPTATVVPTATPTADYWVKKIAYDAVGIRLTGAELTTYQGSRAAIISYHPDRVWDEWAAIHTAIRYLVDITPKVFEYTDADLVVIVGARDFSDQYSGTTTTEDAIRLVISRETADKIVWSDFQRSNTASVLTGADDHFYIHPALEDTWREYMR